MKIYITTQTCENYGSSDEPHWKFKGGVDYVVPFDGTVLYTMEDRKAFLKSLVDQARIQIEQTGPMYEEYVVDWSLEEDDFLTHSERQDVEFYGKVKYPAHVVNVNALG